MSALHDHYGYRRLEAGETVQEGDCFPSVTMIETTQAFETVGEGRMYYRRIENETKNEKET